ncbi:ubiquinol oxidase subunit II [Rhizobium sp. 2YAF20]|uniref:ubiquinol oxidase subunit II n=1 Tax=Rhizobium sp. 2YAF20 TaxID=3233027 RepID=UPI003F9A9C34
MWNNGILAPQGPVAAAEAKILFDATVIMLAVIIPVILATIGFAWWFRDSNTKARYLANWTYSGHIELVVWSVPALVVMSLGGITWIGTHDLDPYKPLQSSEKPLNVQVVSLDWKWLFVYPDEGIATTSTLVVPASRPIHFSITSATVMNSFFIPQLGSQIYAMTGMVTQLNLKADQPGDYRGLSAQFSGSGFSDMVFVVKSMRAAEFQNWVDNTRKNNSVLDQTAYGSLSKPGTAPAGQTFGKIQQGLFDSIVRLTSGRNQAKNDGAPQPGTMEMQ